MVLQLYGSVNSTSTKRVALILHEKNIPFEIVPVDLLKGEHKSPECMKHQPFGQVPYINDDGFILYESRAICRYIATKYASQGPPLIPTDLKAYALFEQAASIEQNNFDVHISAAAEEKIFKSYRGLKTDEVHYRELLANLDEKLDAYNVILGKQAYLAGDEITLADLFHIPYGALITHVAGSDIMMRKPNVARWWNDLICRNSWMAVKNGVTSSA